MNMLDEVPAYARGYFELVGEQDPIALLRKQLSETTKLYKSIPSEKWDYAYAEGKWTIKEVLGHLIDSERIFQYRALRFGRGDTTDLPGFDQDIYVAAGNAPRRSAESLIEEYETVRKSSLLLFEQLNETELERSGTANGAMVKVRWLAYMSAGHEMHHLRILKERYGVVNLKI